MIKWRDFSSDGDPDPPDPWPFLEDPGSVKIMPYGSRIPDPYRSLSDYVRSLYSIVSVLFNTDKG